MPNENAKKWVRALRSGEYKQTTGCLRSSQDGYCCLGVLCDIYSKELGIPWERGKVRFYQFLGCATSLPTEVTEWAGRANVGFSFRNGYLAELNDNGRTFEEIADVIEAKLNEESRT